jgi:hypothetical protein
MQTNISICIATIESLGLMNGQEEFLHENGRNGKRMVFHYDDNKI